MLFTHFVTGFHGVFLVILDNLGVKGVGVKSQLSGCLGNKLLRFDS
jgi:hypothetical protein